MSLTVEQFDEPPASARVRAGIAVLDAQVPTWFAEVRIRDLHMGRTCSCVLGQLYEEDAGRDGNGYVLGVEVLSGAVTFDGLAAIDWTKVDEDAGYSVDEWAVTHGFDVGHSRGRTSDLARLQRLWKFAIRRRRQLLGAGCGCDCWVEDFCGGCGHTDCGFLARGDDSDGEAWAAWQRRLESL